MIHLHNTTDFESINKVITNKLKTDYLRLFFIHQIFHFFPLELVHLIFLFSYKFVTMNVSPQHIIINTEISHVFYETENSNMYYKNLFNDISSNGIKQLFVGSRMFVLLGFDNALSIYDHRQKKTINKFYNVESVIECTIDLFYLRFIGCIDMIYEIQCNNYTEPAVLINEIKCKSMASGTSHSIFLLENGKMRARGNNRFGQLSLNQNIENTNRQLIDIDFKLNVSSVHCGDNFTIVLSVDNEIYGCGDNTNYQLGLNDKIRRYFLTKIHISDLMSKEKIIYVECGPKCVVVLTNFGNIWIWGKFTNICFHCPIKFILITNVKFITLRYSSLLYILYDESFGMMNL